MTRRPPSTAADFYHVISRAPKEALFTQRDDFMGFLSVLEAAVQEHRMPLAAYCVMKRRWHLLIGPTGKQRLLRFVDWVIFTHAEGRRRPDVITKKSRQFTVTPLRQVADVVPMSRFIERLPLAAGLVSRAEDWPWSSLNQRLNRRTRVPLTTAPVLASAAWCHYVNASLTPAEQAREERRRRTSLDRQIRRPPLATASGE